MEGGTRNLITQTGNDFSVTDWGRESMGSEECLLEFLEYGLTEYAADRTIVILWDHGAGSEGGMCFDETTEDEDGLTLNEINDVLYDLDEALDGFHIDIFGCDACLMATYEMAAMLSYYDIDYFVASEETEPVIGWCYTPWLEALSDDPDISTDALCRVILDAFMEAGLEEDPDDILTLSAINLNVIDPLQEAMEDFAAVLMNALDQGNVADIRRRRSRMYAFGSFDDASWDMVDLGAMLNAYAKFDPEGASEARKCLSRAVLDKRQTDNLDPCSGLSVLIPHDTKEEFETYVDGLDLSIYIPNWIGFVKAYAGQLNTGSYNFSTTTAEHITGTGFLSQVASLFSTPGEGYGWNDEDETYEASEQQGPEIEFGDGDYAFTTKLTAEDLRYLDYVEGMLSMDISDEDVTGYIDLGLFRNNLVDWETGAVYSLFDGTWPILDNQMVSLFDQIVNDRIRRSLIPVKVNGKYTYLVVEFPASGGDGRIIGTNAGYDDNGLPIRTITKLKAGDIIVPVYTAYIYADDDDDPEEEEYDGDEIVWEEGMTVTYEELNFEDDPLDVSFCFVLNDIFGDYPMTETIGFEI